MNYKMMGRFTAQILSIEGIFMIPALLISLGLADVSYGKWFKWSIKFQLLNLLLTTGLLLLGLAIGY